MRHTHKRSHEDRGAERGHHDHSFHNFGHKMGHLAAHMIGRGEGRGGPGHHRGRHGGPFDGPRGGGRRRMFDSGELRLVLLLLLETQARHGYDLIRDIEERTGGAYAPSPGVVYPTLTLLEDLDQIAESRAEGPKRLYTITPDGVAFLEARRTEAQAALARLDALGAETRRTDAGPVLRAMHNLRAVLEQRLSGETDKALLFDVAELIDEAARKIERLEAKPSDQT